MADFNQNATVDNGALNPTGNLGFANSNTPVVIDPALSNKADVGSTIDSSKLKTGSPTPVPELPSSSAKNDFINTLQVGDPSLGLPSAQSLQTDVTNAQGNVDQTTQEINTLLGQLGMKGQDVASMQSQANLSGLQNQLADLNTQFAQKKAEYNTKYNQIAAQGIATPFKQGQLALEQAQAQTELGSLAAQIQAAQGNINTAFSTIDKTISEKYQPIQDKIDAQLKYYGLNKDKLTVAQQKLATRQEAILNAKKQQVINEQQFAVQAQKDLQTQIINGTVDTTTGFKAFSDFVNGKISLGDFYNTIGVQNPNNTSNGNAVVQNTMKLIGATEDMAVSQAITTLGMDKIIAGIVAQEGGTPQGTNNPGNIKFANQPGATQGKQATDGGYFANFATPQDFNKAIQAMVQKAADKGQNLSDFIASYKGVTLQNTPDYKQYGLLADVPDFNPSKVMDKDAYAYISNYIKNGSFPTYAGLFGRLQGKNLTAVKARADDLFTKATGYPLPDVQTLKGNKALIVANNKLANNLNIQEGTIGKNFKLAIDNIDKNGINQSAQPINAFMNAIQNMLGSPEVAQYLTQNATLRNEVGSLLSLKNASGTTVADKLESAGLVQKNASESQQKSILKILLQEAENASQTLKEASGELYKSIDPLETDPKNPNRIEKTTPKISVNGVDLKIGEVYTNAQGKQGRVNADGTITPL